eukprot:scaffold45055_cov70-Phaeocystis_antarctica.AAC.3
MSGEARRRDIGRRRAAHHPWSDAHTWARGGARNPLQTSSPPLSPGRRGGVWGNGAERPRLFKFSAFGKLGDFFILPP